MQEAEVIEIIEQLAMDFVLADPDDEENIKSIHDCFVQIREWAVSSNKPEVALQLDLPINMLADITTSDVESTDKAIDYISSIITALQAYFRYNQDIKSAGFPGYVPEQTDSAEESPDQNKPEADIQTKEIASSDITDDNKDLSDTIIPFDEDEQPGEAEQTEAEQTEEEQRPEEEQPANENRRKVFHPGALPAHLDDDLFADFLAVQGVVLERIEVLILEIEENETETNVGEFKRLFHTLKGEAGFLGLEEVEAICHNAEDVLDELKTAPHADLFLSIKDWLKRAFDSYSGIGEFPESSSGLIARIDAIAGKPQTNDQTGEPVTEASPEPLIAEDSPITTQVDNKPVISEPEEFANATAENADEKPRTFQVRESVSVDAERMDRLIDTIGELVITESMLTQDTDLKSIASPNLTRHISQLAKITRELQIMGLSMRMVPIKPIFQKMGRIVRDLAKKSGKNIKFVVSGEDTELDKTLVDKIGDPLLHLVRNAVDHGIENTPQERIEKGKPESAIVEMRAFHKGGRIFIEIEDDGTGIDTKAVQAKAVLRGLVVPDDNLSDKEIFNLLFEPGLSTAKALTDVSGRGVGMDVVKRNIEELRGQIDIESTKDKGSVFSIRIPLTLAIMDGIVVRIANEKYIIPTLSIITSYKPTKEDLSTIFSKKGEMISVLGQLIPIYRLSNLFSIDSAEQDPTKALLVVIEEDGKKAALMVDELMGKQQVVIKSLGETLKGLNGISGGAIMPDGRIGLILDVGGLVKLANEEQP